MANDERKNSNDEEEDLEAFAMRLARQFKLAPQELTPRKETWVCGVCGAENMNDNPDCWNSFNHPG
jgi:hypothetical protein